MENNSAHQYQQPHDDVYRSSAIKHLRIAIISDAAPSRNGVGTYYVDLMEHLRARVDTIEMICPTIEMGKWQAGLVLPLPGDSTQKLCMPNPFQMQRDLTRINPNVIVIATPGVYGLLGAFLASRMAVPAIAGFHTSFEQITELYWTSTAARKLVHGYFKVSNNYLFRKCRVVLANSDDMVQQAQKIDAQKIQLISTAVSPIFTQPIIAPFDGDFKRILFAGRLAPEKNIETILEAAEAMPECVFTLAGDGPLRKQVEDRAAGLDNVTYLGWLERDQLRQQIDRHDALILPSHFESFGTIALEAMARERLVIVSPGCGIAEWPQLNAGFYITDDLQLLPTLKHIQQLLPAVRQTKAKLARQLAWELNELNLRDWQQVLLENNVAANR